MVRPFVLFGEAAVTYRGRATSTLERGNYLVIYKPDRSLAIHAAEHIAPRNYQNSRTTLCFHRDGEHYQRLGQEFPSPPPTFWMESHNRGERLIVAVYRVYWCQLLTNWAAHDVDLKESERELVSIIQKDLDALLGVKIQSSATEVATPYGPVDLLAVDWDDELHVIEAKRRRATISACSQVGRYAQFFRNQNRTVHEYVASPSITSGALAYCEQHGQRWLQVKFKPRAG